VFKGDYLGSFKFGDLTHKNVFMTGYKPFFVGESLQITINRKSETYFIE